ncbi:GNAT family N-acetyltransferase [Portibacter lacus]|uniref:N-acetyltransferase n=1 Tax=Portibacter lacus TaxID=1099794 RepID=A0AA37WER5_9BACT|nr:GNAT family N-acetyltransferase [Portibacter lacus]GLR16410.1 N-acetyltransferase [Portibacter lacus]
MLQVKKTDALDPDFIFLVKKLDEDLAVRDGDDHDFYDQFNKIDQLKYTMVGYVGGLPVACGAIKAFDEDTMEVKRMYVNVEARGQGYASRILSALEEWAKELKYSKCILETGRKQPEAIALYKKNNYLITENYGQYKGIGNSVCFEKALL